MVKKLLLVLGAACCASTASAQTYLWPVKGAKAGQNIIAAPQSYIGNELNRNDLYVGAPLGTEVVSPADGTITSVGTAYYMNLTSMFGGGVDGKSFDEQIAALCKDLDKQYDPQYISGSIGISVGGGTNIHLCGLSGDQRFKTGQKIGRGEVIGRVAYAYKGVPEPSIRISVSKNAMNADPMTPFGLKTTYKAPEALKPITTLTKAEVREDFLSYMEALKECYPGLYDLMSKEELEQYIQKTLAEIDAYPEEFTARGAIHMFEQSLAVIHDSHLSRRRTLRPYDRGRMNAIQVGLGWFDDTLRVRYSAHKDYDYLVGRPVARMNGRTADEMRRWLTARAGRFDGKVESALQAELAYGDFPLFRVNDNQPHFDFNVKLEMADNGQVIQITTSKTPPKPDRGYHYFFPDNYPRAPYNLKMLNDSVAYIQLTHFSLNQVAVEDIARFIDSIERAKAPHAIFDVRNNGGGDADVLSKLYSYIAGKPMTLYNYSRVNKQGGYQSFQGTNRLVDDSLFANYQPIEGKEGYYMMPEKGNLVEPDSLINYKGKVYVLTNEQSVSAATLFPALVVRNHRGVTVGRETRTAYHFMNALKFVDYILPNSTLVITIPLVHCVFDTVVNARVPYGRGVLPDFPVELTIQEVKGESDSILNYTLQLIEQGRYLSPIDPFEPLPEAPKPSVVVPLVIGIGVVGIAATVAVVAKKRGRKQPR